MSVKNFLSGLKLMFAEQYQTHQPMSSEAFVLYVSQP